MPEAKVLLADAILVGNLWFGRKRHLAWPADMATPRPCWLRPARCGTPTGTAEARPGSEACRADTGTALGDRPVSSRSGFRGRRIRRRLARQRAAGVSRATPPQLTVNPTNDPAEPTMFISLPLPPRRAPWPAPRVMIVIIVLTFIVLMASLGYAPAVALGLVAAAAAIADDPGMARAVLGA